MSEVVLDKSYLEAASPEAIGHLCDTHTALMSDVLFYELITTRDESRQKCFGRLPDKPNPVTLIPNVGFLLRFERENRVPCVPLFQRRLDMTYVFNRKLREGNFIFEGEVLETVKAQTQIVETGTKEFIERCMIVHQFFPELNGIPFRDFRGAVEVARRKIASNVDFVREIYASFLDEEAPPDSPDPALIDEQWAWFRWVQCHILCGLRIFAKHQGRVPDNLGQRFWTNAEHSMHDVDYVIHGALAGGIASDDREPLNDFLLVRPDGLRFTVRVPVEG